MNMHTMSDWKLIQQYAKNGSEAAFAELVRRHLSWVYSVALRRVRQPELAEEVAQSVFVLLARKAGSLRSGTIIGGWLFRTTCFVGSRALRAEQRLKNREQTASSMTPAISLPEDNEAAWGQLAPQLDQAVAVLSEPDRTAILLRFYQKKPMQDIADQLRVTEEAAKKRVSRAVDKLRSFLLKRGVTIGGAVLAAAMTGKVVEAAPALLESSVLEAAVAGASASAVLPQLARETLRAWRWARIKLAGGLTAGSLAVIFLGMNAAGLFGRHGASPPVAVSDLLTPAATTSITAQAGEVLPAPSVNPPMRTPLKSGVLTGLVMDTQGRPVAGAKVWGGVSQNPFAEDTTDVSGQFALDKLGAPTFITVTADGLAADQQQFDPTNATGQFVFRLSPVPPLNVHLLDESGEGVPGVSLFLANWWGRVGTLAQHLPQKSGADGRLLWFSPPKGELELQFGKTGYRYSRTNKFAADGQEHIIVLHPVATLTGSVTDAQTGAPVMNFEFTAGHSQPWVPTDPTPLWDLHSRAGSNGFYRMVIEEEQVPYLRVQAEGYETLEAQIKLTNGLEAIRDFQLKRQSAGRSIRGTVLLPDGSPAAGVEVALCTAEVGVMLSGTAFAPEAFGRTRGVKNEDYRKMTDGQGAFWFDPKPGAHTVVAAGWAGLGQARCFDFSKPLEIRLQAWGRIEGTVRTRAGQWSNRKVTWSHAGNLTSWMTLYYDPKGFLTTSDAAGNFTLEHVPPGDCRVAIDDGSGTVPIFSPSIRVGPGQTVQVQVGGIGRLVVGRLVAPRGVEIRSWPDQVISSELHLEWADYHIPEGLTGNAVERLKLEFEDTETGRAWFRDQYSYNFKVGGDGSFSIPEVLPGKYRLFVNVAQGYLGSGQDSNPRPPGDPRIASTGMKVSVPDAGESGSPLDIGDIILVADQ
jgi:RNA polymerase sigma factor (sigma-70 family)